MELELAGETPRNPVRIEGAAYPSHKRNASSDVHGHSSTRLKMAEPPTFSGKNIKELQTFEIEWSIRNKADGPFTPSEWVERIQKVATYLKGTAAISWVRHKDPINTWDEFIAFCKGIILDPTNRMSNALLSLAFKKQGDNQGARAFLDEVEALERDIPELSAEERDAWFLLNRLRPDIRTEVMRENKEIRSREQVLAAAQRQEELSRQKTRQERSERSYTPGRRSSGTPTHTKRTTEHRVSTEGHQREKKDTTEETTSSIICYKCGRPGHKAYQCHRNRRSEKQRDKDTTSTQQDKSKN
ncbi:uncharacterized protein PV07_09675 [Cladophialophora immunda]|uniref:CCHC-type domain-containing protein n=1 Tax=Cladophialophora immunda TaxID=569365 RepID=A0A0D2C621_9EURO|nr:uncharacterized protein PV07_09675 [Cladophialophora immunda]KIW26593.1 hypothetical protein PV07_09675 [Cladophialophora immunda]